LIKAEEKHNPEVKDKAKDHGPQDIELCEAV